MDTPTFPLISEVMKLYAAAKESAELDLGTVDTKVLPGMVARKNIAATNAESYARELRGLVETDGAAVLLLGPTEHQMQFAELAEDEGDAIVIDAQTLYEELATFIEPYLGAGRTFTPDTAQALQGALYQIAVKLRILSFIMPAVHNLFGNIIPAHEDLVKVVREMVRAGNSDELNALFISHKAFERVINDTSYDANVVTVVVTGATEEEAKGDLATKLFEGRTVTVDVKDPPEKNDIVLVAKKLKPFYKRAANVLTAFNAHKARAAKTAQKQASTDAPKEASTDASTTADEATTTEA